MRVKLKYVNVCVKVFMVGLKEVAQEAGVSTTTVSHVLNKTRFVSPKTKQQVYDAVHKLGYRPNLVARSLRQQKSKVIGVIVPIFQDENNNLFFMKVSQGIEKTLKKYGYSMLLSNSNEDIVDEKKQIEILMSQMIEGLIVAPCLEEYNHFLKNVDNIPIGFIDRLPENCEVDCALSDNYDAIKSVVNDMVSKGYDKIAYIGGDVLLSTGKDRYKGYVDGLVENGIVEDPDLVRYAVSDRETGRRFAEEIINKRPQCLIVGCNTMLMGVMDFLSESKICVPKDMKLVGFDDRSWTQFTRPSITVIRQPEYEIGESIAEIIIRRIEDPALPRQVCCLKTKLIYRDSY